MKKKLKNNITLLNVISNISLQLVTMISGFIIPRIILTNFGSEVNGLVSSLNQFLNYIIIFEGGLGGVVLANLYKPLYNKDSEKISSVIKTTHDFYHKLAMFFVFYTIAVGLLYPLFTNTSFSYLYIFSLTIILSITLFIQYNFSLSYKLLLQADKKVYIVAFTQIILTILNIILFIIIATVYPNIHILKLVSAIVFLLQPIIFSHYANKYYNINKMSKIDNNLLNSRWDGFAINIASFIHNSTDISILTIFSTLKMVSVYSIYCLVTTGLKKLIISISSAISPTIGQSYAKGNIDELSKKFELYEYIIHFISFFLFTVGGLLITPFVLIYSKGITDINYNQPLFGLIIVLSELMYVIRDPYVSLAYSANKFKEIKKYAYIEAIINIIISLILVPIYGIIGVAIGTLISITYRTICQVIYLKKNILQRSLLVFFKKILSFGIISLIGAILCIYLIPFKNYNIINFLKYGIIYSFIIFTLYLIMSFAIYKNDLLSLLKRKKEN